MRLHTFLKSPNPLKVRLALAELGVPYEAIEVNLFRGEQRAEAFGDINPHRKVPVLEDGGELLAESNAILAYLGRTRSGGSGLWPVQPLSEAHALRWLFFEAAHLMPHAGVVWWADKVAPAIGRPGASEPVVAAAVEELERALGVLEAHLTDRAHVLGEGFSLADCAVGVAVEMLRGTRLEAAERWPAIHAYRGRVTARASWTTAQGYGIHELG